MNFENMMDIQYSMNILLLMTASLQELDELY